MQITGGKFLKGTLPLWALSVSWNAHCDINIRSPISSCSHSIFPYCRFIVGMSRPWLKPLKMWVKIKSSFYFTYSFTDWFRFSFWDKVSCSSGWLQTHLFWSLSPAANFWSSHFCLLNTATVLGLNVQPPTHAGSQTQNLAHARQVLYHWTLLCINLSSIKIVSHSNQQKPNLKVLRTIRLGNNFPKFRSC